VAELSGGQALAAHYAGQLAAQPAPVAGARLDALLAFCRTLATRPVDGDKALLLSLPAAGLSPPEVITLAQLVAYLAYQVRVVAGAAGAGRCRRRRRAAAHHRCCAVCSPGQPAAAR
jgi:uncharacterized protein YciW